MLSEVRASRASLYARDFSGEQCCQGSTKRALLEGTCEPGSSLSNTLKHRCKIMQFALNQCLHFLFFCSQGDKGMTPVLFLFWSQVPVLNKLEYFICFTGSVFLSCFPGLSDFTRCMGGGEESGSRSPSDSPCFSTHQRRCTKGSQSRLHQWYATSQPSQV